MTSLPNKNLIVDGNNLAHRCAHVFSLSNKGEDVSVTYGFLRTLSSYISKFSASSVTVCWDGGTPLFRKARLPEYKAHRVHSDDFDYDDFLRQIGVLEQILPLCGILSVRRVHTEADDLMYHASRIYMDDRIIITTDKDLLQALMVGVYVYSPTKDVIYDVSSMEKEYGIDWFRYLDWRALQGDDSDNIPGIPGVGEKTATKLIAEFGDISGVYNASIGNNPKGYLSDKLAERIKSFGLNKLISNIYVSALYCDRVGAKRSLVDAVYGYSEADVKQVKRFIVQNGFTSLLENGFLGSIRKLGAPELLQTQFRIPSIMQVRESVV